MSYLGWILYGVLVSARLWRWSGSENVLLALALTWMGAILLASVVAPVAVPPLQALLFRREAPVVRTKPLGPSVSTLPVAQLGRFGMAPVSLSRVLPPL